MEFFLDRIARSLYSEFGNNLNRHCLVFPSRRAGLYLVKYLSLLIEKPVWSPSVVTVNELFRVDSELQQAGNEILLFELYREYRKLKKGAESFDEFYFWGDMLLNDFDDVDKYLVDASLLFRNIQDLKLIDQKFGGLTEEQAEIISRFWINFDPSHATKEKTVFISLWSILLDLYLNFRRALRDKNLAYEGMIFRDLAENNLNGYISSSRFEMFHFIGFNALNECEKKVMAGLKRAGKARFYWDYDLSFISDAGQNSAGFFLRENLRIFGNDMPADWSFDTLLTSVSPEVKRQVIDTSSDIAQVKLIPRLLAGLPDITEKNAHHTAVVLADENLLMPLLSSLPEMMGDINITMGYPLKHTLIYTLVRHLMELQRGVSGSAGKLRFDHREVINIIRHTLLSSFIKQSDKDLVSEISRSNMLFIPADRFSGSEYLARIFRKPESPSELSEYLKDILSFIASDLEHDKEEDDIDKMQKNVLNEFIYRIVLSINRLETLINDKEIGLTTATYLRILDRMLRMQSVPFSGEPLSGIQVMGILETRALDFSNLILLSVNEGVLPAVSAGASFIPYSLREAFGLPSLNHQESIYAYHFYRLIQRAENVFFVFNSNSDGLRSGEMSRFLIQMKYESPKAPEFTDLKFNIQTHRSIGESVERTEEHLNQLRLRYIQNEGRGLLSPSAINTWLSCRMKFFYRYVNNLKEPQQVSREIDPAMLGNILHKIMKVIYSDYKGKVLTPEIPELLLNNPNMLGGIILKSVRAELSIGDISEVNGNELIVRDVLMVFITRILNTDSKLAPVTLKSLEEYYSFNLETGSGENQFVIPVGGQVDRVDILNGICRIVDYKTGSVSDSVKVISDLFKEDRRKDDDAWLQTLLYCEAWLSANPGRAVRPSVYKIKRMTGSALSDKFILKSDSKNEIVVDDYNQVRDEFIYGLKETINAIFSNNEPFTMTTDRSRKCSYCPYRLLCMR